MMLAITIADDVGDNTPYVSMWGISHHTMWGVNHHMGMSRVTLNTVFLMYGIILEILC